MFLNRKEFLPGPRRAEKKIDGKAGWKMPRLCLRALTAIG